MRIRTGLMAGALLVAWSLLTPTAAHAAESVTVGQQTRTVDGTNAYRSSNHLVMYTPAHGASTRTNQYGFEAAVVGGKVTQVADGVGNMAIPASGYVLSGHGTSRTWLRTNAKVGVTVAPGGTTTPSAALLPDVGVRTLRGFSIVNTAGKKMLKFPAVTANVGDGPLEIRASRSSTTSTDWVGRQTVLNSNGTKTVLPATGARFYYAGDGHAHWHIRDFDLYQIFNSAGTVLKEGEKHGFCFEDNTSYRDWVGRVPGVPTSPVYAHETSCGESQPNATSVVHGLSKGWADTYPATLPDQGIDITGLADGTYKVVVTADWQDFWREKNERNQMASAQVRISGNTVTLVSATDGL